MSAKRTRATRNPQGKAKEILPIADPGSGASEWPPLLRKKAARDDGSYRESPRSRRQCNPTRSSLSYRSEPTRANALVQDMAPR
eukprot:15398859-Alexandrium_andersonii.AAC.1